MEREAYWRKQIAAFERSGLSIAEYSRREGIKESRMCYWRARFRKRMPEFVQVGKVPGIEIELAGGARLKIPVGMPAEGFKAILEAVNALSC